ncbi:MAG TPA: TIR domain-containing protein [Kofleriaceae bacterium]|nr:TIR domain-containing protein [Kofleriaceae bacterium]
MVYPINDIALRPRSDYPGSGHVCYAGTETGVSFCWLINIEGGEAPRKIVVQQLWRDLYRAPVLAVRPWEPTAARTPYDDPVVFIATQDGCVAIYRARRGAAETPTLSTEAMNYRFEGMRFDRVVLPGGLVSWAIQRGRSEFLAASPRGRLEFGEFHHPRGSVLRAAWLESIDRLYGHVMSAPQFFGAKADEPRRREICAMISIRGGALRSYILRKQFEQADLTEARLDALLAEQFQNASSDLVEVQDRIKVAIKMVRTRVLDRDPDTILEDCLLDRTDDSAEVARVRWACRRLSRYLVEDSAQARPGAVRVRRVIMYALFRVNVLRHAARDEEIQSALEDALTACLRDEDRIVRVEALRAVAVGLRNVSLLFAGARDDSHREAVRRRFFPPPRGAAPSSASGGLETIQWLVDAVLRNFARYRRHGEPVLLSTAWSYTTVLVSVIRLFPGSTLALCEQITRWGLGDHLQIVHDRLRGGRIESVRWRIRELCIVPSVRPPAQPRTFIDMFNERDVSNVTTELALAPGDSDRIRASGLLQIYSRVALLWNVDVEADLMRIPLNCRQRGALPEMAGDLAGVKRILEVFVEIADGPPDQRRARLAALHNEIANEPRDRDGIPEAIRLALEHVVQRWQAVLSPKIPTTHAPVATYTLEGRRVDVVLDDWLMERGNGQFYAIKDDPGHIIKILRGPLNKDGLEEFHRNARLSREMAERYPASFVEVYALNPTFGYAVMDRFQTATEYFEGVASGDRPGRARIAAVQLVRALRYLHDEGLAHRDLRAKNILVSVSGGEPIFRFGDLHLRGDEPKSRAELEIPVFLRNAAPSGTDPAWIDLLSLTLFLYWALTGNTLPTYASERSVAEISARLRERADEDIVARVVSVMLSEHPHRTAQALEWAITFRPPRFERRALGARPLAPFDVFISYKGQDSSVARALHTQLTAHGFLPYLDQREVYSERIANEISVGVGRSRAFAILIGDQYRDDRFQAMEVRAALDHSGRERLPLIVLQLGERLPDELEEARATGAIRVIRARRDDVPAMAREIVATARTAG